MIPEIYWTELGDAFKAIERDHSRTLPPKNHFVTRLDGRSFHNYTRGLAKPFDTDLVADIDTATRALLGEISGAVGAYCQSDEISVFYSDTARLESQIWFGGKVDKINSVAASIFSAAFCLERYKRGMTKPAAFDARTIPVQSLGDYLAWRSEDCHKNAINMIADVHFSHKQLDGVSTRSRREMLAEKGINVDDFPQEFLYGRTFEKVSVLATSQYTHKKTGEVCVIEHDSFEWQVKAIDHRRTAIDSRLERADG